MSLFPIKLAKLEKDVLARLDAVELLLREEIKSDYELADITARHLVEAGGKRFRPLLVLLAAQFGDPDAPGVIPAAVVVELTHLATLYHDDVMDEAMVRRAAPSANSRWGNTVAILSGDFLFARSSKILADLGPEAVRVQAQTFERLVIGQLRESVGPQDGEDAVAHHIQVLADKTGSLISAAGRYGAMMSGVDEKTTEAIAHFGECIGVAFQLSDDLIDIESSESGKTPGTDLREGIKTLPVLLALADPNTSDELRDLLSRPLPDAAEHARALSLLRAHPALGQARSVLANWSDRAKQALDELPDIPTRTALNLLIDNVTERKA
ncbi:MAG: polyprenyl synthetase family protein [Actinomycetales bacterium]|nr:polyprenyl synthetase family protein [Actinomycetales bacterium]